jgi:hypothetical protein
VPCYHTELESTLIAENIEARLLGEGESEVRQMKAQPCAKKTSGDGSCGRCPPNSSPFP